MEHIKRTKDHGRSRNITHPDQALHEEFLGYYDKKGFDRIKYKSKRCGKKISGIERRSQVARVRKFTYECFPVFASKSEVDRVVTHTRQDGLRPAWNDMI